MKKLQNIEISGEKIQSMQKKFAFHFKPSNIIHPVDKT
jgi:hypothetical protein